MDELEKVGVCPLGGTCREIKDNKIHQCEWYIKIKGKNRNTDEDMDKWGCAMAWMPVLLIENSAEARGLATSVQGYRNETNQVVKVLQNLPTKLKSIEAQK